MSKAPDRTSVYSSPMTGRKMYTRCGRISKSNKPNRSKAGVQTRQAQDQIRQLSDRRRALQENIERGNDMTLTSSVPAYVSLSYGSAQFRMGNLVEAEKAYKEAIAADARSGEAHNNLAVVYLETGRLDEAEKSVQAAERAGFNVHPQLKEDIRKRRKGGMSYSLTTAG